METEELRSILHHFGELTFEYHTQDIASSIFYGISVVLFSLSTRILLNKGFDSRATLVTFTATLIGFTIITLVWVASVAHSTVITRTYSTNNSDTTLQAKIDLSATATYTSFAIFVWGSNFLPILSDAVVIWRTWVLFPQQKWVMIGPLSLLLGTFATTTGSLVISPLLLSALANQLLVSAYMLSLATNSVSTLLIFWQLWTYRKSMRKKLGLRHKTSLAYNILVVLLESGFIYLAFQVMNIIFSFVPVSDINSTAGVITIAIGIMYFTLSGMYPTIIVILVHSKSSMDETYGISALMASKEIVVRDVETLPMTTGHLSVAPQSTTGSAGTEGLDSSTDHDDHITLNVINLL